MSRPQPTIQWLQSAVDKLADQVPKPQPVKFPHGLAYRYVEKTVEQAVIIKLARYVSGLSAGTVLQQHGFFQELCVLQRVLDEINEDVIFLTLPLVGKESSEHHHQYLDSFWEEEPSYSTFAARQQNRHSLPRKHIRAYLSKANDEEAPDHSVISVSNYLSRLYSGFVHAAAPQSLELYDEKSGHFQMLGFPISPFATDHVEDFQNQFFRGNQLILYVSMAFSNESLAQTAHEIERELALHYGS